MELEWKRCENLLKRMAESMGLAVVAVPDDYVIHAHWYIAQRSRGYENKLTATYFSPADLLDEMLHYYQAFNLRGRVVDNLFYGMSPEEIELRLAVMGVQTYGNEKPEAEDRMLRWIAGRMGLELHYEAEYVRDGAYEADRWWFMSKPFPRGYTDEPCPGWRMTTSFYTQRKFLDDILGSRTAFLDGGQPLHNPFYGMSRDEIALRMAVAGA